jgi:hypothetical protein
MYVPDAVEDSNHSAILCKSLNDIYVRTQGQRVQEEGRAVDE